MGGFILLLGLSEWRGDGGMGCIVYISLSNNEMLEEAKKLRGDRESLKSLFTSTHWQIYILNKQGNYTCPHVGVRVSEEAPVTSSQRVSNCLARFVLMRHNGAIPRFEYRHDPLITISTFVFQHKCVFWFASRNFLAILQAIRKVYWLP